MIIIWALYILAAVFVVLDHYLTVALIGCGYTEANLFVRWLVAEDATMNALLYYKIVLLGILGVLLFYKQLFGDRR